MPISPKAISAIKHYLWGLIASAFNGATSAVAGILGVDIAAFTGVDSAVTAGDKARVLNGHEMVSCFVGAFVLHAFLYFKSHPLPETYGTEDPFPRSNKDGVQPPPPQP